MSRTEIDVPPHNEPRRVTARAPGKVNLSLYVGPLAPDGFHPLVTVFQALDLYEQVTATTQPVGNGISLTVTGSGSTQVPTDASNLAWRAAAALANAVGIKPDVALHIDKGVPVAGGMAGGSADAAATLVAVDTLWGLETPRAVLLKLAAQLGSDVPFCLEGGTAIGTDRGQVLTPVTSEGRFHWALAVSDTGLSTPKVFAAFDRLVAIGYPVTPIDVSSGADVAQGVLAALRAGDAAALGQALSNDLEPAAIMLRSSLAYPLEIARDAGALGVTVSGSGPTVAALAESEEHAREIAAAWVDAKAVSSTLVAAGPAPGARVIAT